METAWPLLCGLVMESGTRWGESATSWQIDDARAILAPDGPRSHYLTRPRGGSKTTDLAGIVIALLLTGLPQRARCYGIAADRDQGALLIDAIGGFVARTPGLSGALTVSPWKVTASSSGASFEVLAADGPSAFGLRPHLLVVDELAAWSSTRSTRRVWEAITSAIPKVPDARLVAITSAGDPAHFSHKVLEHARFSDRWRVSEVPGPCPWIDPAALEEQQGLLTESQYRRLHLNEWAAPEDRLANIDDLRACVTLDGPLPVRAGCRYVVAVDLGLTNDRTVAVICHLEPIQSHWEGIERHDRGQRVVLDRIQVWAGDRKRPVRVADVEDWITEASRSFSGAQVVCDPWQAVGMAQRLEGQGVRVETFTFTSGSVGRLASTLHRLIRDQALALPDDPDLLDELANVRLRETSPGVLRMDHDTGRHDDRAIALALAAVQLLDGPTFVPRTGHYRLPDRSRGIAGGIVWDDDPADTLTRLRAFYEARDPEFAAQMHARRDSRSGSRR